MPATEQLSITLPLDMAHLVRSKVATAAYATESDVVRDGLESLLAHDRQVDDWLRDVVGAAHDALSADPTRGIGIDEVRAVLAVLAAEDAVAR